MPSRAEVEAVARALMKADHEGSETMVGPDLSFYRRDAEAALTAAEKVREGYDAEQAQADAEWIERYGKEARTQPREYYSPGNEPKREARTHTCHTDCPCQTGGKPRPDFVEGRAQPCKGCDGQGVITATLGGVHGLGEFKCPDCQPETGQLTEAEWRSERYRAYMKGRADGALLRQSRIVALICELRADLDEVGRREETEAWNRAIGAILTAIQEGESNE